MSVEIERKFLVRNDSYKQDACAALRITQGYICRAHGRTVRVRTKGDKAFLTIKGPSSNTGMSRYEWEKEIPVEDALELLQLCTEGVIDKTRYLVRVGSHTFEVDEFYGDNEGLVEAEVELGSEDEAFDRPSWLGEEVTGQRQYYNSSLIAHPYKEWQEQ